LRTPHSIPNPPQGFNLPKIWIAEAQEKFQPPRSPFRYPEYACDFGIEQDFLAFLEKEYPLTVETIDEADYVYIPFFWTRYHLQNNYGSTGLDELQAAITEISGLGLPTFTVCQYDDGPLVNLENCRIFLGSRKTQEHLDAPLLATRLPGGFVVNDSVIKRAIVSLVNNFTRGAKIKCDAAGYGSDCDNNVKPRGPWGGRALCDTHGKTPPKPQKGTKS
jgi:hypothetical protein